ncbi:MAG: 4Fe-4S binding protein [Actinomycetota bacterium]|nr:MAG: 4Fe-4S [Actinomycetota bacterium]MDO8949366.1 4Fe-4S binding protein [Actinomycetota bacterium]MDP3629383.1 4Fe-4S binding protein [Actinomycetota bacterium]
MCEFCVQHGDGKLWYLEASNYAYDLENDLERRGYLVEFVTTFDKRMTTGIKVLDMMKVVPRPIGDAIRGVVSKRQQKDHFGQPVPLEDCEKILDIATSVVQLPCVCRHREGEPEEGYCLAITVGPVDGALDEAFRGFADGPDTSKFQRLSKDEALAVLRRCESEGLMHSVWTFKTPFISAICNCNLASGCMAMKTTLDYHLKVMWKGEYVASVDSDLCTACGACFGRCPFSAIKPDLAKRAVVTAEDCYGCGTCRSACRKNAISLRARGLVPEVANSW